MPTSDAACAHKDKGISFTRSSIAAILSSDGQCGESVEDNSDADNDDEFLLWRSSISLFAQAGDRCA